MDKYILVLIGLTFGYTLQTWALVELGLFLHIIPLIILGVGSAFAGVYVVIDYSITGDENG